MHEPMTFSWQSGGGRMTAETQRCGTLVKNQTQAVADTLKSGGSGNVPSSRGENIVSHAMSVRRLTPTECERLQGFPDGWTAIPYRNKTASECPDGPRYKALGNSMAVPVMRWIGYRLSTVDGINQEQL